MSRTQLLIVLFILIATSAFAQQYPPTQPPGADSARPEGRGPDGLGPAGGFRFAMTPEMIDIQVQSELEVWTEYLALTDAQAPVIGQILRDYTESLAGTVTEGTRQDTESIERLQQQKALDIYDALTQTQQRTMQAKYDEIQTAIQDRLRTRLMESGAFQGRINRQDGTDQRAGAPPAGGPGN